MAESQQLLPSEGVDVKFVAVLRQGVPRHQHEKLTDFRSFSGTKDDLKFSKHADTYSVSLGTLQTEHHTVSVKVRVKEENVMLGSSSESEGEEAKELVPANPPLAHESCGGKTTVKQDGEDDDDTESEQSSNDTSNQENSPSQTMKRRSQPPQPPAKKQKTTNVSTKHAPKIMKNVAEKKKTKKKSSKKKSKKKSKKNQQSFTFGTL